MTEACLMKLLLKLNDSSAVHEEQPVIMKLLDLMWGLMQVSFTRKSEIFVIKFLS